MRPLSSIAVLFMAHEVYAHFRRFQPRQAQECCPCPGSGNDKAQGPVTVTVVTVTVIENAPAPGPVTVYVSRPNETPSRTPQTITVHSTVTKAPLTVYVTQDAAPEASAADPVEEVIVQNESAPEPVTVVVNPDGSQTTQGPGDQNNSGSGGDPAAGDQAPAQASDSNAEDPAGQANAQNAGANQGSNNGEGQDPANDGANNAMDECNMDEAKNDDRQGFIVTEIVKPADPSPSNPKTVPVSVAPAEEKIVTDTPPDPAKPFTVTATPESEPSAATEEPKVEVSAAESTQTVVVSPKPAVETVVSYANSLVMTTTASASAETASLIQTVDHFQTVTQSIHNGDNINIEVTVVNIDTGERTCIIQDTGLPCGTAPGSNLTVLLVPSVTPAVEEPCPPGTNLTGSGSTFITPLTFNLDLDGINDNDNDITYDKPADVERLRARRPRESRSRWH